MTRTIYLTEREIEILNVFMRYKISDDLDIIRELDDLIEKLSAHHEDD